MYRKVVKPYLSIIIPYHNSVSTIGRLLLSIKSSRHAPPLEVIVVDDGSSENAKFQISNFKWRNKLIPLRFVALKRNHGPAVARNRGAKLARGKFLVFLDSDVELFADTLYEIARIYTEDPDIVALTGVWVKEQRSKEFFPNFKALRDWSYWINERDKSGYYFLFSTRIASIKKSVFMRLGGFDERYPAPLVEDIELTYRIARRYAIIFAPTVRVKHEFESFWPIAKKYFLRAYYWTKLYQKRKKFDPVATTLIEALTTLSGVGVVGFVCIAPIIALYYPSPFAIGIIKVGIGVVFIHLFLIQTFLRFVYKEKGLVFAFKSLLMGLVLYCVIFAGAGAGRLRFWEQK